MPIGSLSAHAIVINDLCPRNPKTILDLGIGTGFYGASIRQWLNYGNPESFKDTRLEGIEGFAKYRNPLWSFYDVVTVYDIRTINIQVHYDCILLCDVIEHMSIDDGLAVIEKYKKNLFENGVFYIITPGIFCEQGGVYGNEFEVHRSLWTDQIFIDAGFEIMQSGANVDSLGQIMIVAKYTNTPT